MTRQQIREVASLSSETIARAIGSRRYADIDEFVEWLFDEGYIVNYGQNVLFALQNAAKIFKRRRGHWRMFRAIGQQLAGVGVILYRSQEERDLTLSEIYYEVTRLIVVDWTSVGWYAKPRKYLHLKSLGWAYDRSSAKRAVLGALQILLDRKEISPYFYKQVEEKLPAGYRISF